MSLLSALVLLSHYNSYPMKMHGCFPVPGPVNWLDMFPAFDSYLCASASWRLSKQSLRYPVSWAMLISPELYHELTQYLIRRTKFPASRFNPRFHTILLFDIRGTSTTSYH
jgi:hypothetical protein